MSETRPSAIVFGAGIAAVGVSRLLRESGWAVSRKASANQPAWPVRVSPPTAALLRDLFGLDVHRLPLHQLRGQMLHWGGATPVWLDTQAAVVEPGMLEASLAPELDLDGPQESSISVHAQAGAGDFLRFGTRHRATVLVGLTSSEADDYSCMESVTDGWLYLLPVGNGRAVLQAVMLAINDPAEAVRHLLDQSTIIRNRVAALEGEPSVADVTPTISTHLLEATSIRCGRAAATLDPVCGDGVGHAGRTAVLAAAVLNAPRDGISIRDAGAHYEARLRSFVQEHLSTALRYYREAKFSAAWNEDLAAMVNGAKKLSRPSPYHPALSLQGRKLVRSGSGQSFGALDT